MYDLIIVGAGPAGLSAAIYAVRAGLSTLVLEGGMYGGQIIVSPEVDNYPGIAHISGAELAQNLYDQAAALGAAFVFETATGIEADGPEKVVITEEGRYTARALILATGAKNRPLGLPREEELTGRGVSYCATCDGMFFKGKDAAVVGGGNTALEDAAVLAKLCGKVYLVHRRSEFRGEEAQVRALRGLPNVEFVLDSVPDELAGEHAVEGLWVKQVQTGARRLLPVSAVFVAIGQAPQNEAFRGAVELDGRGYLVAGEDCRTSLAGVFAAGDGRTKTVRQLVTAASDGAAAALAAAEYLRGLG